MLKKILWSVVILSILASFPLIIDRYHNETSTKQVEVVVDYDRLERLSARSVENMSVEEMLDFLKQIGVTSVAIHEQSVREFVDKGMVQLYTTNHLNLFEDGEALPENHSLILFSTHLTDDQVARYQEMIIRSMPDHATAITWRENQGILVQKTMSAIQNHIVGFDFESAELIKAHGLQIVARVYTARPWQEEWLDEQFARLNELGVRTIVYNGREVLGFEEREHLEQTAEWFKQYGMNMGMIEFHEQIGDKRMSSLIDDQVIRLLSISEATINSDPLYSIVDTLSLAVLERNVRLAYLNLPFPSASQPNMEAEDVLKKANTIVHELYQNIRSKGYDYGVASPFISFDLKERGWHNIVLIIGSLALISLLAAQYHRFLIYLPIPLGLLGYLAARMLDMVQLVHQAFSLATAIAAPTLATILIYQWAMKHRESFKKGWLWSLLFFALSSIISLYGAVVTVGLLNGLEFVKYLEQFRGVQVLYFMPSVLFVIYLFMNHSVKLLWERILKVYHTHVQVKHIIWVGLLIAAVGYYLSRSGNEGVTLPYELEFRQLLNDIFGVRPRTKEVLLGHPLFILATYLVIRYKKGAVLLAGGIIGQMSIVSTFTHLHTPLLISLERTIVGLLLGAVIGLVLILLWHVFERIWRKRERQQTHAN
ncbi:DUF5693 family protein [Bacillus horti]|uniref:Uncharacterized protein n=1 Tax=Caldalkalibacillus horti TaxID=77523 RepID=A0ABT9VTR7_9BACI|nr:DUF5693 family protein [Bacillus horti]MDQ0164379.1 hypothetical protein [Bacillus horti]